jgi:hypothetical protein
VIVSLSDTITTEGEAFGIDGCPSSLGSRKGDGCGVAASDDQSPTASERLQEIHVQRCGPGRFVLRVGDEVRVCSERDLPGALRQSLGLGHEDARALADALREDA